MISVEENYMGAGLGFFCGHRRHFILGMDQYFWVALDEVVAPSLLQGD
jgi:hypothetical protein